MILIVDEKAWNPEFSDTPMTVCTNLHFRQKVCGALFSILPIGMNLNILYNFFPHFGFANVIFPNIDDSSMELVLCCYHWTYSFEIMYFVPDCMVGIDYSNSFCLYKDYALLFLMYQCEVFHP